MQYRGTGVRGQDRFEHGGELLYGFTATGLANTLQGIGNLRMIVEALYERGYLLCRSDRNRHIDLR